MSLVTRSPMDVADPVRPAQGSLWILKLWLGTVILGYVLGAYYGRWLPRLCQQARRGVSNWGVKVAAAWEAWCCKLREGVTQLSMFWEDQVTLRARDMPMLSPPRAARTRQRMEFSDTSPEEEAGGRGLRGESASALPRRRSISPKASSKRQTRRTEEDCLVESDRGVWSKRKSPKKQVVVEKMLESVSPRPAGKGN